MTIYFMIMVDGRAAFWAIFDIWFMYSSPHNFDTSYNLTSYCIILIFIYLLIVLTLDKVENYTTPHLRYYSALSLEK